MSAAGIQTLFLRAISLPVHEILETASPVTRSENLSHSVGWLSIDEEGTERYDGQRLDV